MNDTPADTASQVIDLRSKFKDRASPAEIARDRVRNVRQASGLSVADFAAQLSEYAGWTVTGELVSCWEDDITPPGDIVTSLEFFGSGVDAASVRQQNRPLGGVRAGYRTRGEFVAETSVDDLFGAAHQIHAVGLSHNLLCQQYPNPKLVNLINDGASVELLFLKPEGEAVAQREEEEGYEYGDLSSLTRLNISTIRNQVRPKLTNQGAERLAIGTYDEIIRFNLIFIDRNVCVMQPYLHGVRGLETPTFVLGQQAEPTIFDTMWTCYEWLQGRATFG